LIEHFEWFVLCVNGRAKHADYGDAGANLLEVKRRAGHERSSFTMDRYGHLFPNADEDLAHRLDELGNKDSRKHRDGVEELGA
jgi:hypothetical protein